MILFVFEGQRREPELFRTIQELYFRDRKDHIICSYNNNIYNLYKEMSCDGDNNLLTQDIISVLIKKWENHKQNPFPPNTKPEDFSETYLFFDLDLHNQNSKNSLSTGHKLDQIRTLVNFFNDETGNGKMYISYPMIESVRYTKELPDNCFHTYTYPAFSTNFKQDAAAFSAYPNLDFISFRFSTKGNKQKGWEIEVPKLIKNWMNISKQHILKAN